MHSRLIQISAHKAIEFQSNREPDLENFNNLVSQPTPTRYALLPLQTVLTIYLSACSILTDILPRSRVTTHTLVQNEYVAPTRPECARY
jgi:hypothetical protein